MAFEVVEGTIFAGRYRLIRRLAAGAMGAVYEALHLGTNRRRALKVMLSHVIERPELRKRFELEARVTAHVDSPFIVEVFDAGVDDATAMPFLVMELLRGEELGRCLRRVGRFSPEETLACLYQTACALDKTHAATIVHRDLKPANLFLSVRDDGARCIKILDFGVAKIVAESTAGTTQTVGTPMYMAPEQFRGQRVSAATDIYALGMMAYTFLAGEAYWADEKKEDDNLVAFALNAAYGPVEPATARAARKGVRLPSGFDTWFAQATAVDPERRFATATAAVRALGDALGIAEIDKHGLPHPAVDASEKLALAETIAAEQGISTSATGGTRPDPADTESAQTESAAADVDSGGSTAPNSRSTTSPARKAEKIPIGSSASRRFRGGVIALLTLSAALLLAVGGVWAVKRDASSPTVSPPDSPLQSPSSVLACPIFEATGIDEPSGWLGAAAASLFCERARVVLGGTPARTLVPAELLGLPRQPVDRFPVDPYAAEGARRQSLDAARRRAAAYIDGQVVREASGFRVVVTLHRPDGGEIDRGTGTGRALYEAVRQAMDPLVARGHLPKANRLDPAVADYTRARDVDGALLLLDLALAIVQNAGNLRSECDRLAAHSDDFAEMGAGERFRCAYTLGLAAPSVMLPPFDPASPGSLAARARVDHMVRRVDDPAVLKEILRRQGEEPTAWGRSVLASTASCMLQSSDPRRALEAALLAVQAEPKNPTGEFCAPWIQLVAVTSGTASGESALRGMQAWMPWESYSWQLEALGPEDPARALAHARRAYTLSPFDTYVADTLANRLLSSGAREEARGIGLALAAGGSPVHSVASELILARVEASEARFGAALARARRAMVISPEDAGWVRVQRLNIAWLALELGVLLGRGAEIADLIVERFLDAEPAPLDGAHLDVPLRIPAICAHASPEPSRRCFARFRALREKLSGGILPGTDAFVEGAERYARGDLAGAARAWRSLLRDPGPFAAPLADAMVSVFERAGEMELVDKIEAAVADAAIELNGASPATVRAARRAARRGDRKTAEPLARKVIEAWSVADEAVPAVEELRRHLGRR